MFAATGEGLSITESAGESLTQRSRLRNDKVRFHQVPTSPTSFHSDSSGKTAACLEALGGRGRAVGDSQQLLTF